MSKRGSSGKGSGDVGRMLVDDLNDEKNNNNLSDDDDDDNNNVDLLSEDAVDKAEEDPLLLAMDDLEGRVVAALEDMKLHPGVPAGAATHTDVHDDLAVLLRPVLEVAAHTGPSIARTYHRGTTAEGLDVAVDDVYQKTVSDLVLPVLLEMAQSDAVPTRRTAALEFFRSLWKETHKAGSWLDATTQHPAAAGPYGVGGSASGDSQAGGVGSSGSGSHRDRPESERDAAAAAGLSRLLLKRRKEKRLAREGEILRYWVQASISCTQQLQQLQQAGLLTSDLAAVPTTASRRILAATASLRPSLKHIVQRIKDADDRGANRLYSPVMKMIEGVLKLLFLSRTAVPEPLLAACVKVLEILCLSCSRKPIQQDPASQRRKGYTTALEDFSLEDLPEGHPVITREALESIADYAFTTLRGLALMGGQVKLDVNLLSDMMLTTANDGTPSSSVVSILKPAALAFLEIESSAFANKSNTMNHDDNDDDDDDKKGKMLLEMDWDRSSTEFDFLLSQKSYAITINAMEALATNRPVFFKDAATCLARRAYQPPLPATSEDYSKSGLTPTAVKAITQQLKASCLTLLRHALSVTTNAGEILTLALKKYDMELQAEKAFAMAKQANSYKTLGRAARNRANLYYEWDTSESDRVRSSKRQRETDDALAKLRAAKAARGLGHGIQLPTNMADAVELILANLVHLPNKRPVGDPPKSRKVPITLDLVVDAIMTNGASLLQEEGRWYDRDGGTAWSLDMDVTTAALGTQKTNPFQLSEKFLETMKLATTATGSGPDENMGVLSSPKVKQQEDSGGDSGSTNKRIKLFQDQCHAAASDAVGRIVATSACSRSKSLASFGNQIAARLAFTLKKVQPSLPLKPAHDMAKESIASAAARLDNEELKESMDRLVETYPLAAAVLALNATPNSDQKDLTDTDYPIHSCSLNEAMLQSCQGSPEGEENFDNLNSDRELLTWKYDRSLDLLIASTVHACEKANEKPMDTDRKKIAAHAALSLQRDIAKFPRLTPSSLLLVSAMCDIEDITKKAAESARKTPSSSQDMIAASAATHAAKVAAEKRATAALLILRDTAFQRDVYETRKAAVQCAVGIAAGRLPASAGIQEKALQLVMNILFAKNETLAKLVIEAATAELERASDIAIEAYDDIKAANKEAESKEDPSKKNPLAPHSEKEKQMMDRMRKPAVLYMALCVRRPDRIDKLFQLSCLARADVLSKAVRANMSKLSRAAAAKHGAASLAINVAAMAGNQETPMLLAFLENLSTSPDQELIDACFQIQELKTNANGENDPRFIIPVVSAMKRKDLVKRLPEFVSAPDKIFLAALVRMGDRVARHALLFRDELDEENPTLTGMTLCEQLVFLHKLDFTAAAIPQKRYLTAIKLMLEDDEVYNDRVLMSALDHMSGTFLTGLDKLPLAFMRTCMLVCTKHESLHAWIAHLLLPRLVDGKIYEDPRQWEGWMRCAHMLEKSGEAGVNAGEAIHKLPPEQLMQYNKKWAGR